MCKEIQKTDCQGGKDLGHSSAAVNTSAACCAMCQAKKGCKAWTWNVNVTVPGYAKVCYMHDSCPTKAAKDGVISGSDDKKDEAMVV